MPNYFYPFPNVPIANANGNPPPGIIRRGQSNAASDGMVFDFPDTRPEDMVIKLENTTLIAQEVLLFDATSHASLYLQKPNNIDNGNVKVSINGLEGVTYFNAMITRLVGGNVAMKIRGVELESSVPEQAKAAIQRHTVNYDFTSATQTTFVRGNKRSEDLNNTGTTLVVYPVEETIGVDTAWQLTMQPGATVTLTLLVDGTINLV